MSSAITQNPNVRLGIAAVIGAVLGMLIGWCTNAAMVEISINAIFALYFGFFFLFLAGVITWRVVNFSQAANRHALLVLSGLMGLAGLICVFYQRHWFFSLSAVLRVPIYAILGVSLSFALSFAIAELLNYASTHTNLGSAPVAPRAQSALVQSPQQIFLLAVSSVSLGFVYGIIFGFAEIGKGVFTLHTLRTQFLHEERICLPIGALVGAATGFLVEKWRPAVGGAAGGGSGSSSSGSGSSSSGRSGDKDRAGGLSGFGAEPNPRRSVGNDAGGPTAGNAFASSDADGLDEFDPFPTSTKTKY